MPEVHCPNCGDGIYLNGAEVRDIIMDGAIVLKCACGTLYKVVAGKELYETYVVTSEEAKQIEENKKDVADFIKQYLSKKANITE